MKLGAPQVVTAMYDSILYLVPQVSKFPRSQRYLLGDRLETACFNYYLENELWRLHEELAEKRYTPGRYHHFTIYEPKQRVISAAPYRDRVVHHALHNVLEPIFDPTFIHDSYATRKGKGTHAAIDRSLLFERPDR